MDSLKSSIALLDKNFNIKYQYPIIIFYQESDEAFSEMKIREVTRSPIFFQQITFELPPFVNKSAIPKHGCRNGFNIGYRHMCRFHAIGVYELPILRGVEYVWRLDDDSLLLRPINYDIFDYVHRHDYQYSYMLENDDHPSCVFGLWEATESYIRRESLTPHFFRMWPRNHIFYNNFEILATSLWNSTGYRKFMRFIDEQGGIFYYRWGDAPIKTLAVSLFVPRNKTHRFIDIGYEHLGVVNP